MELEDREDSFGMNTGRVARRLRENQDEHVRLRKDKKYGLSCESYLVASLSNQLSIYN